ncbi:protein kinase domain-containing protein [Acanthopleuribacter pedis]|uniref:Protein kinase n=1 Tax=Acanthopleuribacter pedis TaxID=442870 RepID=A0A8J7U7L7_9BACT|nr:protein kinase [Acanthopleuribacter pedis]MBO1321546.1 protein kinase [Acanthopleuribacter pedis]
MILIAESHPEHRNHVQDLVSTGLKAEVHAVENARKMIASLKENHYDLLLLNANLPDYRGSNLVKKLREKYSILRLPIIAMIRMDAGVDHHQAVLTALHSGANDCLFLPLDDEMALARIQNLVHIRQEFTVLAQRHRMEESSDTSLDITDPDFMHSFSGFSHTDAPIPCDLAVQTIIGPTSYTTRTKWINNNQVLVVAYENLPSVSSCRLKLEFDGAEIDLEVREAHREDVEGGDENTFKINYRVIDAPPMFDALLRDFRRILKDKGREGLSAFLMSKSNLAAQPDEAGMTLHFGSNNVTADLIGGARYQYEGHLGEGAFASVYLVKDHALKRSIAMKVLNQRMTRSKDARVNFLYEAQTAAQFHHPNIAFVYEVGEIRDTQYQKHLDFPPEIFKKHPERIIYLTMQFIEGTTLTDWMILEEHREEEAALPVLIDIAKAMAFAHEKGVIHRDIKPDNIMITPEGQVIVTDFGIANRIEAPKESGGQNVITCTPRYASPEQLFGEDMDGRSDMYSFGTVAYELLTGQTPFPGRTIEEVIAAKYKRSYPPIDGLRGDISKELVTIINRCLEFETSKRFPNAADLLAELLKVQGAAQESNGSLESTLTDLIDQAIMVSDGKQAGIILARLVAFLNTHKTKDDVSHINEIKTKLSEPSLLQVLIEKNLTNHNQQMLYEFFIELQSTRAVLEILNLFQKERETWKKSVLAELAVVSAGRDLEPLAVFGLELTDRDAPILLRAFAEVASQTKEQVFLVWANHKGLDTQRQLLKIIRTISRPREEIDKILEYFVYREGTAHMRVRQEAMDLMREIGHPGK